MWTTFQNKRLANQALEKVPRHEEEVAEAEVVAVEVAEEEEAEEEEEEEADDDEDINREMKKELFFNAE